jgi:hypothetical protein
MPQVGIEDPVFEVAKTVHPLVHVSAVNDSLDFKMRISLFLLFFSCNTGQAVTFES